MKQTQEQEARLLKDYEPYIASQVRRLCNRGGCTRKDQMDDLMQEARIAFLLHSRRINDPSQLCSCSRDILRAVWDYWVEMAVIHVPRARYLRTISGIQQVAFPAELPESPVLPTDEAALTAELDEFLASLTPQERTVVRMKLDGYSGRAIMPHAGVTTEVQMSRLMKRIRQKAKTYFQQ